jgi:hypothetical protein
MGFDEPFTNRLETTMDSPCVGLSIGDVAYGFAAAAAAEKHNRELFALPHAALRYAVSDPNGICAETVRVFGLERLQRIKQLGGVNVPMEYGLPGQALPKAIIFGHTRYQHVHDVMAVGAMVGFLNSLDDRSMTHLKVACLSHDALMPATGDTVKEIDQDAFDEDALYPNLFKREGWQGLRDRYKLDPGLLSETILNRGRLGQLLDLADKIAYVSRDSFEYLRLIEEHDGHRSETHAAIRHLAFEEKACEVWRTLTVQGDCVASNDPETLVDFLSLRILMFNEVYYGTRACLLRMFFCAMLRLLFRTGELKPADLFHMEDDDVERIVFARTGVPSTGDLQRLGRPCFQGFSKREDADCAIRALRERGVALLHLRPCGACIKPRVDMPVLTSRGITPLWEVRPDLADELTRLAQTHAAFVLYWMEDTTLDPGLTEELLRLPLE